MDPDVILFDEPTSALDPANVGEVEAVIRDLANSGKTLLVVTHDMLFSRSICNRVFFMDQGGIYDDDVPEVIFDNPQKERTRRFIRRLKVLELMIDSNNYDFLGEGAAIDIYCHKNQLSPKLAYRIRSVIEELVKEILLPELDEPKVNVVVEYNERDNKTEITVRYNGPEFDPCSSDHELSLAVLKRSISNMVHTPDEGEGYTNRVFIELVSE